MKTLLGALCAFAFAFGVYHVLFQISRYPPGILIGDEPVQSEVLAKGDPATPMLRHAGFDLQPRASIAMTGRVLHSRHYTRDEFARLMPYDLAVGWGPMSDQAVLDRLRITQADRFFFYEYQFPAPLAKTDLIAHATNLHLIAPTAELADRIARTRVGDLVKIRGLLVNVTKVGAPSLFTSLSRNDTGPGACEIVWVDDFRHLPANAPVGLRASSDDRK